MKFIFEVLFLGCIIVIADIQSNLIASNKPINHRLWGSLFAFLIGFAFSFEGYNWWFLSALLLEHFVFFPVVLNFLRQPRKPIFYVSSVGKNGSMWDFLLLKVGSFYPEIWALGLIGFILIQFKL